MISQIYCLRMYIRTYVSSAMYIRTYVSSAKLLETYWLQNFHICTYIQTQLF